LLARAGIEPGIPAMPMPRTGPALARTLYMPVELLFVVALLVGYSRPVFVLVLFPLLLIYGGMWALGPLAIAIVGLVVRDESRTLKRRRRTEPEYRAGYES
jgi:hypothetical protein